MSDHHRRRHHQHRHNSGGSRATPSSSTRSRRDVSTQDPSISAVLNKQNAFRAMSEQSQIDNMISAYRFFNIHQMSSLPIEKLRRACTHLLRRFQLFWSLSTQEKLQYLSHLRAAFESMPNPAYSFEMGAFITPSIEHFVRSIRTRSYNEARDGNWFTWWDRWLASTAQQNGISPGDQLRHDAGVIGHLLEYEYINSLRVTVPNELPPISDSRQQNGSPLPEIQQIFRPSTSGSYSSVNWSSQGYSNAANSNQQYSSQGRGGY
ncbi:hypothetical protein F4781DRAFT_429247 [Annulohypoxylon bovei var. microspora]|nr:hypothetical protein F4781DRAFT_429247 [Annulohypoxylon bovei var. microspora]